MAWNGSDGRGAAHAGEWRQRQACREPSRTKLIYLAAILACLAVGVAVVLSLPRKNGREDNPPVTTNHTTQARPVANYAEAKQKPYITVEEGEHKWRPNEKPVLTSRVTPPARLTKDIIELGGLPTNCLLKAPLFSRSSDNWIGGLITAVPGDSFLSDRQWDKFDDDFVASLKEPIEIGDEDSEEDRLIKEAVVKARWLLSDAMDRGEKPSEIMRSAQQELEKIATYRDQLNDVVEECLKDGDVDGAVKVCEEANRLLAEYNARPIEIPERRLERIKARIEMERQQL